MKILKSVKKRKKITKKEPKKEEESETDQDELTPKFEGNETNTKNLSEEVRSPPNIFENKMLQNFEQGNLKSLA
jgi:hypothetical protein